MSRTLAGFGREFYQRECTLLRMDAAARRISPERFRAREEASWPGPVREFRENPGAERFTLTGPQGNDLQYLVRHGDDVWRYSRKLGSISMNRLSEQYAQARRVVEAAGARDLRRGFRYTYIFLAALIWLGSLVVLVISAHRISGPIHRLTEGLSALAAGNLDARVTDGGSDEVGIALRAFNHMAEQLRQSQHRLVYLTRVASWQALARKMAHEVKNSLTPIRLTMEELIARRSDSDRAFLDQAAQIVVDEVNSLEQRVRAFSEFASEPPVRPEPLNLNSVLEERVALLKTAHPSVTYDARLNADAPAAYADPDLIRGALTNLLENAAQAVGPSGTVLGRIFAENGHVCVEIHDSGPGFSPQARETIFEPTISFKKGGMGLGLSIAYKSVLMSGGEIVLVDGELGGAGFRVVLPSAGQS